MTEPRYTPTLVPLLELQLDIGYERTWHADGVDAPTRSAYPVDGGEFWGERVRGTVEAVGMDWVRWRADGAMEVDMRTMLRTHDDHLVALSYTGLVLVGDDPENARSARTYTRSAPTDAPVVFSRTTPRFETSSPEYAWLTRIVAVAKGTRNDRGPHYSIFEVA